MGKKRDDNPVYETELNESLKERILSFRIFNTPYIEDLLEDFEGKVVRFRSYDEINFSGQKIVSIDRENNGYEIELSNGVDIKFDKNGNFLRYDD